MERRCRISSFLPMLLLICSMFLSGCTFLKITKEETTSLDYTIVKEEDLPEELSRLIEEKKEQPFQMAYKSGEFLYLLRGYGQQLSGGYSIRVEDLNIGTGAIVLKTTLLGPENKEQQTRKELSYPYIVLKLQYREDPVRFE